MATNLLELAKGFFTGPVTRQISGLLGESEATTESAIEAAVPSVLAGLGMQASTPNGASALSASLDRIDTSFLGNLDASLGSGDARKLMDTGTQLVKSLFGNSFGTVADSISRASGMGKAAIGSLLGLVAPVVMGLLAKQKKAQGLGASDLSHLLVDQEPYLAARLPSGVGDALGLGSVRSTAREAGRALHDTGRSAARAAGRVGGEAERHGSSLLRKLLPLLLVVAIGVVAWRVFAARGDSGVAAQETTAPLDGFRGRLQGTLESARSALADVTDEASARAALPRLEEASRSVTALSAEMQAMPETVRTGLGSVVQGMVPELQALADKALALPGVAPVIGPALQGLMDGLAKLRA